jgi:hypothetical protein
VSLTRYATVVLATVAVVFAAAVLLFGNALDGPARSAMLFAGLLAAANAVSAYFLATWASARQSNAIFMQAVLGGMLGRMMLMLAAVLVALVLLDLPKVPLIASLLTHFVLFLVLEVAVLSRRAPTPSEVR